MYLNPECTLDVLRAFSAALPLSAAKRKAVKALVVLNSDSLSKYSDSDIECSYRYLLAKRMLELQYPGKAPALRGFPSVPPPSKSQYLAAATKHHRVLAVTTSGYNLLDLSQNEQVRSKIKLPQAFKTVCDALDACKNTLEIFKLLGIFINGA